MICRKKYIHRSRSIWLAIFCFFEFDLFNCLWEGSTKFKGKVSVFPIFEFFHAYGQSNQSIQNKTKTVYRASGKVGKIFRTKTLVALY